MLLPTFLSSAALALTANAFLLPLQTDENGKLTNILPAVVEPGSQSVKVDCSSCPYALSSSRNGRHEWTNDVKSELKMKFTVSGKDVALNGVPFFPVKALGLPPPLYAKQTKKDSEESTMDGFDGKLQLSYSIEVESRGKFPSEDSTEELLALIVSPMGLEGEMINVDDIHVMVTHNPETNQLTLITVRTMAASPSPAEQKCSTILCRVFSKIASKIASARQSAAKAANKVKCACVNCVHKLLRLPPPSHDMSHTEEEDKTVHLPTHRKMRPGKLGHHGGFKTFHRSFVHHFLKGGKRIFKFVLLPILIGIAFGMGASALGMLVGQVVVFLWLRYRRPSASRATYEPVARDEKADLPKYEDLEAPDVEVVAKQDKE